MAIASKGYLAFSMDGLFWYFYIYIYIYIYIIYFISRVNNNHFNKLQTNQFRSLSEKFYYFLYSLTLHGVALLKIKNAN